MESHILTEVLFMTLQSILIPITSTNFFLYVSIKSTSAKHTFLFFFYCPHKKYIENILKQEDELEEMNLKEPRTEEEKENAANLLDLVKVRKNYFFSNRYIVLHCMCHTWNSVIVYVRIAQCLLHCNLVVK